MQMLYVVEIDPNERTGLFNAVVNRISREDSITIINLNFYDSLFIRIIKRILGKKSQATLDDFYAEGLFFKTVNVKQSLVKKLRHRFFSGRFKYRDAITAVTNELTKGHYPKFDVIVAHWGMSPCTVTRKLSIKFNLPYINVFHGSDINTKPDQYPEYKIELKENISKSSGNIFVSQSLYEKSKTIFPCDNFIIINNGADVSFNMSDISYNLEIEERNRKLIIGYVGNHLPVKGVDFIPATAKYLNENPIASPFHFVIVGSGPLTSSLKLNMPENCTFTGKLPKADTLNIIKNLDLLIVPSRNEGFPLVIGEALLLNTNVVASKVGGIPELLDNKFLVEQSKNFPIEFGKKILEVISNNESPSVDVTLDWAEIRKREKEYICLNI